MVATYIILDNEGFSLRNSDIFSQFKKNEKPIKFRNFHLQNLQLREFSPSLQDGHNFFLF